MALLPVLAIVSAVQDRAHEPSFTSSMLGMRPARTTNWRSMRCVI
jgi:hypothetical protein